MRSWASLLGIVAVLILVDGCAAVRTFVIPDGTPPERPIPSATGAPRATASPSPTTPADSPTPEPSDDPAILAGFVIVLDPGHNAKYDKAFNTTQVPAGGGATKACNTSGTSSDAGWGEHAYNWAQALALREELESLGAEVLLTRSDDNGLGPCVNVRAGVANDAHADLLISIHADGAESAGARGFHVILSTAMDGGAEVEAASRVLAENARDALERHTAMPRSTYIGKGTGLSPRSDIATVNLLESTPGIMVEMGNMRQSADIALLASEEFRAQAAQALAEAAVETLAG